MRSDDDVVAAAKRGDPAAWRELYRAHAGRLVVWLETRTTSSDVAAEDVAAESWLVAAQKIADFHGTASEFAGWLFGIGRLHAANARRRNGRRTTIAATMSPVELVAAGPEVAATGTAWVRDTLATLPDRERDVLACMEVLDLDAAGTAEALGVSAVAVRVARHRGLKRLRGTVAPPVRRANPEPRPEKRAAPDVHPEVPPAAGNRAEARSR